MTVKLSENTRRRFGVVRPAVAPKPAAHEHDEILEEILKAAGLEALD
jgi:hypothetical protein